MVKVRKGTVKDINFIKSCMLSSVKRGRLVDSFKPASVKNLESELRSILVKRHTLGGKPSSVFVYLLNGNRIGFAITNRSMFSHDNPELYAMAVSPRYRGRGYGRLITNHINNIDGLISRISRLTHKARATKPSHQRRDARPETVMTGSYEPEYSIAA